MDTSGDFEASIFKLSKMLVKITSPTWWRQAHQRSAFLSLVWRATHAADMWPVLEAVVSKHKLTMLVRQSQES